MGERPCIDVRGLCVELGSKQILNNLNMQVPSGCVFCLLGPSGCGKTTLMRSTVGLYQPHKGSVMVLGSHPRSRENIGRVSYVPQTLGLHLSLSAREQLTLYARICGMTWHQINMKLADLNSRLKLPEDDKLIRNMSSGQQKLVSVCAALITSPALAVLDEPTVGLDPKRREEVWKLFDSMVAHHKTTVFVTTHHVSEASHAHLVAMMRFGAIVVQAPPAQVVKLLNAKSLEDAYVVAHENQKLLETISANGGHHVTTLSSSATNTSIPEQDSGIAPQLTISSATNPDSPSSSRSSSPTPSETLHHHHTHTPVTPNPISIILAVMRIFTCSVYRSVWFIVAGFLLVLTQFYCVGACVGPKPFGFPVAVLSLDGLGEGVGMASVFANILVNNTDSNIVWDMWSVGKGENPEHVIQQMDDLIKSRRLFGAVVLPHEMDRHVIESCKNRSDAFPFELRLHAVDSNIVAVMQHEVYSAYLSLLMDQSLDHCSKASDPTWNIHYVWGPLETITNYLVPAIFTLATKSSGILFIGSILMQERDNEAVDRLQALGVEPLFIAVAPILAFSPFVCCEFFLRFGVMLSMEEGSFHGSVGMCFLINYIAYLLGAVVGLALCMLAPDSRTFSAMFFVFFWWMQSFSGAFWPIESLPTPLYVFSACNPALWLAHVFRQEYMKGTNTDVDTVKAVTAWVIEVCVCAIIIDLNLRYRTPFWVRLSIWYHRNREASPNPQKKIDSTHRASALELETDTLLEKY
eukprot:c11567_g1_i1.p1 GENE.c11567_g1_i1~~c11567_g1_i1.p1  ORF type:complete len:763 (-),score=196.50 c11567_g1_i1:120-2363(-)